MTDDKGKPVVRRVRKAMGLSREAAGLPKGTMKTTSSHPDRDNPRGAVVSSAAKATTQPKKGAPEKREHCSPSLIEDATDGVMEDAKRKGAEERICFQARLVDAVGQAVIATDPQGKVIYWNRAAEELYGWSEEETIGRSIMEVTPSEEMLERAEEIMMELRAGKSWSGEFEVRRKDGTIFPAMATDTPVHDEEGNLVAIIGVSTDITELKQSEELRRSEERFRLLVEGVKDYAIFMLDPEGRITSWNAGAERIKGYRAEEIVGRHFASFYTAEDVERDHPEEELRLAQEQGRYEEEGWRVHKDGTRFWASVLITALRDAEGNLRGFSKLVRDVTERKRAEERKSRRIRQTALRAEVSAALAEGGPLRSILQRCTECMVRHLEAAFARIWTLNEEEDVLELEASAGMYTHLDGPHSRVPLGEYKIGLIGQEHQPHLTNDVLGDPRISEKEWAKREGIVSFTGHPLIVEGQVVGVMAMFAREPLDEDTIEALASVADTVAQGINRKRADEALRRSEASLTEAQRIAHLGNWEWNIKTGEVYWSEEAYRIYGFELNEFSPTLETVEEVFHPDDRDLFRVTIDEVSYEAESYDFEHRIVRPGGEVRWVQRRGEVVRGEGGEPLQMIGTVHDVTEEKAFEERLEYQATHDELTELPNRRLFMDRLKQALRRTRRHRGGRKVAVLYMDLDNFKVVNDSLSHEVGDRLLVAVGKRLRRCLRPEDTLARFGGDEFTVLVEDVGNPEDTVRVAKRIIEALREPFVVDSRELFLKASIGIALGEARQKTVQDLLRDADTAMYQAKGLDDHYRVFEPNMYEQALRHLKLESDLRRAIEDEEFVLCYQPIVDLESGEAAGVEALVRWEHPEQQGLIAPSQFIPVAEEADLVVPMGKWVLEEACRQGVRWQQEHPHVPPLVMSVNLSAKQLQHPDVTQTVEEILEKTGFEARCLSLDITETLYIEALEGNTAALDKLKKIGVRISIDDFGTGYSSLAYLKQLPAETLKIDKSFIKGIGEDLEYTAIVQMIIELAHTLGMEVIAEGVESEVQAEQLKEMECDLGQGFYFSEPLSPEAASKFLAR